MTATEKIPIDRDSLATVLRELIEDTDHAPMDPCLVYDRETGEFSIESKLTEREESEHVVCDRLCDSWLESDASVIRREIAAAVDVLREKITAEAVAAAMVAMDDDYIREYVIGDLDGDPD